MFYECRITKYCEEALANFLGTHPACSWPLWTLSMCSIYFSCHWAAMSCLKRKCFAKGKIQTPRLFACMILSRQVCKGRRRRGRGEGRSRRRPPVWLFCCSRWSGRATVSPDDHYFKSLREEKDFLLPSQRQTVGRTFFASLACWSSRRGPTFARNSLDIYIKEEKLLCDKWWFEADKILPTKKPKRPYWKWDPACFPQGRRPLPYCCFHHKPVEENYLFTNPWILKWPKKITWRNLIFSYSFRLSAWRSPTWRERTLSCKKIILKQNTIEKLATCCLLIKVLSKSTLIHDESSHGNSWIVLSLCHLLLLF